ncbi:glycoside hydrolase family 3 C-terminal domain-containing protein [Bacteroides sp.]|uniref:glycoside hydrolase family 3 C-terminal domain-containing protein n=1 Tax=Bacteroides sp. TaxID=29523 RepID=UPI0025C7026D|nr:glycoside hydrolase family 3 C-terminal domain-containing protein [Bacteroides sp.]
MRQKEWQKKSDVIILCLGEQKHWSGENASRSTISLPKFQELLAEELNKIGKPIILVLSSGRPLELCRLEPLSSAILEIWQPGVAGGRPFAGILSGRINPSGKLSMTFPYSTGQIPIYYNMRQSARPFDNLGGYQDIQTNPLYNFGYGLSYTTYKCSDIKVSKTEFTRNETIIAEVDVTNIGNKSGKETVLWYISDPASSISRPIKELKYFEKKKIQKGKTERYKFEIIPERDLSFVDSNGNKQLETGVYILQVYDKKVTLVMTE